MSRPRNPSDMTFDEVEAQRRTDGRRFPAPWQISAERFSFVVVDANGVPLAHVFFGDRQATGADDPLSLTRNEANRIVRAIARLPALLQPSPSLNADNGFKIEEWDERDNLKSVLVISDSIALAHAAYDQAVKEWPDKRLTLRKRAWLMRRNYEIAPS